MKTRFNGNIAVYAISAKGAELADQIKKTYAGSSLFILEKYRSSHDADGSFTSGGLFTVVAANWNKFDGHVFVMAAGIVVRKIAPLLTSKIEDPAVVVCDDGANFAVSLLSGHIGGGNRLAAGIAAATGAVPVITTATDVQGIMAFDELAAMNDWRVLNPDTIKSLNSMLLDGKRIAAVLPEDVYREYYGGKRNVALISDFREIDFGKFDGAVVASGNPEPAEAEIPVLRILIPETGGIVVGIGCRKGVSRDEVADAVETMLSSNSLKVSDVDFLASCDVKRSESGLLEFAAAIDAEIRFFSVDELKGIEVPTPSERVNERIGCPSVSEAAALAASQGRLIAPKRKFERVTVALAERQGGRKRKSCK